MMVEKFHVLDVYYVGRAEFDFLHISIVECMVSNLAEFSVMTCF